MFGPRLFISVTVLALSLLAAQPRQLDGASAGGGLNAVAEQLGLVVGMLPDRLIPGTTLIMTVLNPQRLSKYGLTEVKANDKVQVTILSDQQVSVVPLGAAPDLKAARPAPARSLVVVADAKGAIAHSQMVLGPVSRPIPVRPDVAPRATPPSRALPQEGQTIPPTVRALPEEGREAIPPR